MSVTIIHHKIINKYSRQCSLIAIIKYIKIVLCIELSSVALILDIRYNMISKFEHIIHNYKKCISLILHFLFLHHFTTTYRNRQQHKSLQIQIQLYC